MKTTTTAFSAASVLLIGFFAVGAFRTEIVSALEAKSTLATSTIEEVIPRIPRASLDIEVPAADASSTVGALQADTHEKAQDQAPAKPDNGKPHLKLVHIVGKKYIDYFTDGTKTYSFPGDPDIDANLDKPDAPIPSHKGLTWVSTSGMNAYDTPSGDLEEGAYAQEADDSFISNIPAYTLTDAASSTPVKAHIAVSKTDPTLASSQPAAPAQTSEETSSTTPLTLDPATAQPATTSPEGSVATSTDL